MTSERDWHQQQMGPSDRYKAKSEPDPHDSELAALRTRLEQAHELLLRALAENLTPEMRKIITAHLGGTTAVIAALSPASPTEPIEVIVDDVDADPSKYQEFYCGAVWPTLDADLTSPTEPPTSLPNKKDNDK